MSIVSQSVLLFNSLSLVFRLNLEISKSHYSVNKSQCNPEDDSDSVKQLITTTIISLKTTLSRTMNFNCQSTYLASVYSQIPDLGGDSSSGSGNINKQQQQSTSRLLSLAPSITTMF